MSEDGQVFATRSQSGGELFYVQYPDGGVGIGFQNEDGYLEDKYTQEEYAQWQRRRPDLFPPIPPQGNTIGRVVGEAGTTPVPASQANPDVEPETEEEGGFWSGLLDGTQLVLDGVGLVPGVGEIADGANALISLGRGDYAGAALSAAAMVPFAGWGATAAKGVRKGAQAAEAAGKAGKEATEQAGRHADDAAAAGGKKSNDGGKVKRDGCVLRPYSRGCPGRKTPHHVVPDRVFRMPSGARIPGGIPHSAGLCVCVDGATPIKKGPKPNEHGLIHKAYDAAEAVLGAKGSPPGTATLGEIEGIAVATASSVTGCNPVTMAAQVRAHHQARGLSVTDKFRADPSGKMTRGLSPSSLGRGATSQGSGGL